MKYIESETVELKAILNDDMKTEVIAFLNSYLGGTIYVGVDDNGNILKLSQYKNDKVEPIIETTLNMFKVTFPNMNYKFVDQENEPQSTILMNNFIEQKIINL